MFKKFCISNTINTEKLASSSKFVKKCLFESELGNIYKADGQIIVPELFVNPVYDADFDDI